MPLADAQTLQLGVTKGVGVRAARRALAPMEREGVRVPVGEGLLLSPPPAPGEGVEAAVGRALPLLLAFTPSLKKPLTLSPAGHHRRTLWLARTGAAPPATVHL